MINEQRAVKHFVETAGGFGRASLALAASAAVCFIINGAKDDGDTSAVEENLRNAIGLGRSSTYRYIGLGRKLTARLLKDFPRGDAGEFTGPLSDVLDARSPQEAANVVASYLSKTNVDSADDLDVYLGAVPRSQRGAGAQAGAGAAARSTPRHASPESVVATLTDQAEVDPAEATARMSEIVKHIRNVDLLAGWRALIDAQIAKLSKPRVQRAGRANGRRHTESGLEIHG